MGTWISMLLICMLMPLSLIFMWYFCPRIKSVNSWMGYRTAVPQRIAKHGSLHKNLVLITH